MTDFDGYSEAQIPTQVSAIRFVIHSEMVPELDPETGEFTGVYNETEAVEAQAIVVDQNGFLMKVHIAPNYQYLLDHNVMTVQQLQAVQTWIQGIRDTIETLLIPPL